MFDKCHIKIAAAVIAFNIAIASLVCDYDDPGNSSRKNFLIPTEKSIARFETRVAKNQHDFRSAVVLSQLYMRQAREQDDFDAFVRAESVLRTAREHSPLEISIQSFLAESLMAQHRFADAKKIAQNVLDAEPNSLMSLSTIGDANMQLGKYDEAEQAYQKIITLSDSPAATVRLARLKEVTGKHSEAIELAKNALEKQKAAHGLESTEGWYHWRVGKLFLESGDVASAKQHFDSAVKLNPDDSESLVMLGKVAFIEGKPEVAAKHLKSAIAIAEKPPYLIALGNVYQASGQIGKANPLYARSRQLMQEEAEHAKAGPAHARERAKFLLQLNEQVELALELAKQDFDLRSDIFTYDLLAWAYYKNNRFADAQQAIEQALAVSDANAEILFHAGMISAAVGDTQSARRRLAKALEVDPHFSILGAATARKKLAELVKK